MLNNNVLDGGRGRVYSRWGTSGTENQVSKHLILTYFNIMPKNL